MTTDQNLAAAIQAGDASAVAAALAAGANPDTVAEPHGRTVLAEAARLGHADIVRSLLRAGAAVGGAGGVAPTPLRMAVGEARTDVIAVLAAAGALAAEPPRAGSPLGYALSRLAFEPSADRLAVLDALLRLGAVTASGEEPPIVHAVQRPTGPAALRLLLRHGADPDQRRADGTPVVVVAARRGDHAAVDTLVEAGADVDATDRRGRTALMYAVERNERPVAAVLLLAGADPARTAPDGATALGLARGWQWQNIQFALGVTSVTREDVPIARTLLRAVPTGHRLHADPALFGLLADVIDIAVTDLDDAEWETRTGHDAHGARVVAARLRHEPAPAAQASWHELTATRDEVDVIRSALVELAYGTTRQQPAGMTRPEVADILQDLTSQLGR